MSESEPTLTESPVPLALARLQGGRPRNAPRGLRTHRPSLQLASLEESADETPRRFSHEPPAPDTDDEEAFSDLAVVFDDKPARPLPNGRRASDATFAERYRKLTEFDAPPLEAPRRASLAVPVGLEGFGPSDKGRRRSWAARLQLERKKRRKSGGNDTDEESDMPAYVRQKRPSWWNVFVPDNMLKNRYIIHFIVLRHRQLLWLNIIPDLLINIVVFFFMSMLLNAPVCINQSINWCYHCYNDGNPSRNAI